MTRRREIYPEIKRLREDAGLTWQEIGDRFGLSQKTVSDYYHDPDRSAARERNRRYAGEGKPCPRCGGRKDVHSHHAVCRECWGAKEDARLRKRDGQIAAWWLEGKSMHEISSLLGWSLGHLGFELSAIRQRGLVDLPYRYRNTKRQRAVVA